MKKVAMNSDASLTKLVNSYSELSIKVDNAKADLEVVKQSIMKKLGELDIEKYFIEESDGTVTQVWTYNAVSAMTDKELARKLLGGDYEKVFYSKTSDKKSLNRGKISKEEAVKALND